MLKLIQELNRWLMFLDYICMSKTLSNIFLILVGFCVTASGILKNTKSIFPPQYILIPWEVLEFKVCGERGAI